MYFCRVYIPGETYSKMSVTFEICFDNYFKKDNVMITEKFIMSGFIHVS